MENDTQFKNSRVKAWFRFIAGLIFLSLFFAFFASGYSPPGVFGEVLRHNQNYKIDASPLFYSEVEHMAELEEGVRLMRQDLDKNRESHSINAK